MTTLKWIDSKKQMPVLLDWILTYDFKEGMYRVIRYGEGDERFVYRHWIKLPNPPNGKTTPRRQGARP